MIMATETKSETVSAPKPRTSRRRSEMQTPITSSMRCLDIRDIVDFTRLSEKTIERLLDKGEFPRPFEAVEDSKRSARRWTLASIEQWVRRRAEAAEGAVA